MFKEVFLKNRHEDNHECFDKDEYAERHILPDSSIKGFLGGSESKDPEAMQETKVPSLGQEDPLEKGMATHSSIFARRILGTEEYGGLQSMGLQRARQ